MSASGPELPPHLLAKRKRQLEEANGDDNERPSGAKRPKSPSAEEKRSRILGPAPPPAPLDQRPTTAAEDTSESSSDDDDFGPSLPKTSDSKSDALAAEDDHAGSNNVLDKAETGPTRSGRDEWMMMPPKQDDLAARLDPTKIRARGFNTGKGAKAPAGSGTDNSIWTETPEQKLKRLQNEAMGVNAVPGAGPSDAQLQKKRAQDEVAAAKIREHNASTRGRSLYDAHQQSSTKEKDDDPSTRAFDREKDIGGMKIGDAQRKEMLNKAAGFGSKFAGGSYL